MRFAAFEDSLLGMALDKTPTGGARRLTDPATGFAFTLRPYVVPLRDAPPLGTRSKGALLHCARQTTHASIAVCAQAVSVCTHEAPIGVLLSTLNALLILQASCATSQTLARVAPRPRS